MEPEETAEASAVPVYDRAERTRLGALGVWLAIGALVVGAGGGFLLGRSTADTGPSTLADAIRLTSQGKLARGDVTGTLQQVGGARSIFAGRRGSQGGGAAGGGTGSGGGQGGGRGPGGLQGTVSSITGDAVTIATRAGDVKVQLGSATAYLKAAPGQRSDLNVGARVAVRPDFSASSSSGSVTAASITIQPQQ